ncbi:MAG: GAF domain-containing protein [Armatimonadetes bacterium]|nr:GAF domain-containing protein [Armatimonadota bacterium]
MRPLLIQDASGDPQYQALPTTKLGLTRYLGVPLRDSQGRGIGTLCFMDSRSDLPLDQEDVQFVTLLAGRVGVELERERLFAQRFEEQQGVLKRQNAELATTHEVLNAMNTAFTLIGQSKDTSQVIDAQLNLLRGLLGYDSAALLLLDEAGEALVGRCLPARTKIPRTVNLHPSSHPDYANLLKGSGIEFGHRPTSPLAQMMKCKFWAMANLSQDGKPTAVLFLGRQSPAEAADQHHLVHLEAVVDQVALLVNLHLLQERLLRTHDELRQTQQQVVQSEKLSAVGTLAASIAHDIKNIVSSLSMELSAGTYDPQAALHAVKAQMDRFAVLSHRLLSYARPRLVAREPVDIHDTLERVLALTDAQLRISSVRVDKHFAASLPALTGDPHQLEHLFVNIILNAVHAMQARGGTLTIRTRNARQAIVIQFEDTGEGIAGDQIPELFEPFTSTKGNGFGLGLFSSLRIVQEHHGSIRVKSKPGCGTTFLISFERLGDQ